MAAARAAESAGAIPVPKGPNVDLSSVDPLAPRYQVDVKNFRTPDKDWLLQQIWDMTEMRFEVLNHLQQFSLALAEMQKSAVQSQLKENMASTSDAVRNLVPPQIYDATTAINAAYAQFWAEKWNQPELMLSYKASGQAAAGEKLLKILHDTLAH